MGHRNSRDMFEAQEILFLNSLRGLNQQNPKLFPADPVPISSKAQGLDSIPRPDLKSWFLSPGSSAVPVEGLLADWPLFTLNFWRSGSVQVIQQ